MYPRVSPTASSALVLGPRLASLSSPAPSQAWEGEMLVRWDGMGTEGAWILLCWPLLFVRKQQN